MRSARQICSPQACPGSRYHPSVRDDTEMIADDKLACGSGYTSLAADYGADPFRRCSAVSGRTLQGKSAKTPAAGRGFEPRRRSFRSSVLGVSSLR